MNTDFNRAPVERTVRHRLCGSSIAHQNCKYAGEITESLIHTCEAANSEYEICIYADKGGLIHRLYGIKVPNAKVTGWPGTKLKRSEDL